MKTFEIFTTEGSYKKQSKDMFYLLSSEIDETPLKDLEIIAIVEHERGKEFLNSTDPALNLHGVSNIPDYTIVWNVVDYLCTSKNISNDAKLEIFQALTKLEEKGKCTMGDLPSDVY